jgi:hypothetical protein
MVWNHINHIMIILYVHPCVIENDDDKTGKVERMISKYIEYNDTIDKVCELLKKIQFLGKK